MRTLGSSALLILNRRTNPPGSQSLMVLESCCQASIRCTLDLFRYRTLDMNLAAVLSIAVFSPALPFVVLLKIYIEYVNLKVT